MNDQNLTKCSKKFFFIYVNCFLIFQIREIFLQCFTYVHN